MNSYNSKIVIRPGRQPLNQVIREFWEYRDLLWMLAVRHVSVRYRQTVLGIAWVLLQPLAAMVIFTVIFGRFAKLPSDGMPYPIFVYSALVLWNLFSEGLSRSGNSLLAEEKLITKVYFPRLIIPLAEVGSAWVDFAISLGIFLPMVYLYGLRPTWSLLLLPVAMLFTMVLSAGVGMALAALNAYYRDFKHTIPFLIQVWLYSSPVVYSVSIVPESARSWYYLNPMAGLIELGRFAITGYGTLSVYAIIVSMIGAIGVFGLGSMIFQWAERSLADYI